MSLAVSHQEIRQTASNNNLALEFIKMNILIVSGWSSTHKIIRKICQVVLAHKVSAGFTHCGVI